MHNGTYRIGNPVYCIIRLMQYTGFMAGTDQAERATLTYVDSRGRHQILTRTQSRYLDLANRGFDFGWGGYRSTLTVRLLRERGLIVLDELLNKPWRVTGRTKLGDQVIEAWGIR